MTLTGLPKTFQVAVEHDEKANINLMNSVFHLYFISDAIFSPGRQLEDAVSHFLAMHNCTRRRYAVGVQTFKSGKA